MSKRIDFDNKLNTLKSEMIEFDANNKFTEKNQLCLNIELSIENVTNSGKVIDELKLKIKEFENQIKNYKKLIKEKTEMLDEFYINKNNDSEKSNENNDLVNKLNEVNQQNILKITDLEHQCINYSNLIKEKNKLLDNFYNSKENIEEKDTGIKANINENETISSIHENIENNNDKVLIPSNKSSNKNSLLEYIVSKTNSFQLPNPYITSLPKKTSLVHLKHLNHLNNQIINNNILDTNDIEAELKAELRNINNLNNFKLGVAMSTNIIKNTNFDVTPPKNAMKFSTSNNPRKIITDNIIPKSGFKQFAPNTPTISQKNIPNMIMGAGNPVNNSNISGFKPKLQIKIIKNEENYYTNKDKDISGIQEHLATEINVSKISNEQTIKNENSEKSNKTIEKSVDNVLREFDSFIGGRSLTPDAYYIKNQKIDKAKLNEQTQIT